MSVGKESIKRAASTSTGTKKTTTRKTTAKAAAKPAEAEVKTSVLTPMDAEEIQAKFLSEAPAEDPNRPVRITEPMPVHLL